LNLAFPIAKGQTIAPENDPTGFFPNCDAQIMIEFVRMIFGMS
jgi:hypothetical protein